MFEVGKFVVYGNAGVCKVDKVGPLLKMNMPKDKLFYTLVPVYSKGSKVFTPVDSDKVVLRPVITKEEATELVHDIDEIEEMWIPDNKKREETFKQSLRKSDCRELISIIKTINTRRDERIAEGKKVTAGDEKMIHAAEENLSRELAVVFDLEKEVVIDYLKCKVKGLDCQPIC